MVVVAQTDDGWIIVHSVAISFTVKERPGTGIHVSGDGLKQSCGPGPGVENCSVQEETLPAAADVLATFRLKEDLFQIQTPFRMDSECKGENRTEKSQDEGTERRKRKRKRKEPLNIGEVQMEEYHGEVRDIISRAYTTLRAAAGSYFTDQSSPADDNNHRARQASQIAGPDSMLSTMCEEGCAAVDTAVKICDLYPDINLDVAGCVNTVLKHAGDLSIVASLQSHKFIIPPRCMFLLSDIHYLNHACPALGKFDLILMDPPWENKSVKRKKRYNSVDNDRLLNLPLGSLMKRDCVVAVWVTNRQKHIRFITQRLFPLYDIEYIARWHWLKVTTTGEMVYDLDSAHKKPYETLIFGRYRTTMNNDSTFVGNRIRSDTVGLEGTISSSCYSHETNVNTNSCDRSGCTGQPLRIGDNKTVHEQDCVTNGPGFAGSHGDRNIPNVNDIAGTFDDNMFVCGCMAQGRDSKCESCCKQIRDSHCACGQDCTCRGSCKRVAEVPDNKVVVSVPCSLHSKKPPLAELLRDYLPPDPLCLELFARNLTEGWTSWGNEVIQHQHVDYYERIT